LVSCRLNKAARHVRQVVPCAIDVVEPNRMGRHVPAVGYQRHRAVDRPAAISITIMLAVSTMTNPKLGDR
jgi:hypothetical protein